MRAPRHVPLREKVFPMRYMPSIPRARARSHARSARAFTLVELLVVIGIVTILIGILMPVISRARVSGNRTSTLSNLRQIGAAVVIYANDAKGAYPVDLPDGADEGRAFP